MQSRGQASKANQVHKSRPLTWLASPQLKHRTFKRNMIRVLHGRCTKRESRGFNGARRRDSYPPSSTLKQTSRLSLIKRSSLSSFLAITIFKPFMPFIKKRGREKSNSRISLSFHPSFLLLLFSFFLYLDTVFLQQERKQEEEEVLERTRTTRGAERERILSLQLLITFPAARTWMIMLVKRSYFEYVAIFDIGFLRSVPKEKRKLCVTYYDEVSSPNTRRDFDLYTFRSV